MCQHNCGKHKVFLFLTIQSARGDLIYKFWKNGHENIINVKFTFGLSNK